MRIPAATKRLLALLALLSAISLAVTASATADIGETIIQRCTHGQTLSGFSQAAYARALKELSADAEEYTDCSQLIRQAVHEYVSRLQRLADDEREAVIVRSQRGRLARQATALVRQQATP